MKLLGLLSSFALASGLASAKGVVYKRQPDTANTWKRAPDAVDPDTILPIRIALSQRNLESAENELLSVSDPLSPDFGNYWSSAEVASRFAPTADGKRAVVEWLQAAKIEPVRLRFSQDDSWILFNATVAESQNLLQAQYAIYKHADGERMDLATEEYTLPENLAGHVDFIIPTIHLGGSDFSFKQAPLKIAAQAVASKDQSADRFPLSSCAKYTTPDCLRAMYGIPATNESHPGNSIGIYEPSWASWVPKDLDKFFDTFDKSMVGRRPAMEPVNGGYWQDSVQAPFLNAEANLDFQYVMALTNPLPVINYQVGDIARPGTWNNLLAAFDRFYCPALNASIDGVYPDPAPGGYDKTTDCGTISKPARVLSISYAFDEVDFPEPYLRRQCIEFLKLGLQGVSVIVSSADCGVAGKTCKCISDEPDGPGNSTTSGRFRPTTPASCPYVTAVGGTQLPKNGTVHGGEVAFRHISADGHVSSSGGGFSNVFSAPSWQVGATRRYLERQGDRLAHLAGRYNAQGRGIPDVSANAANYVIALNETLLTVMGTSASAPTFASVVAKINHGRLSAGKKSVGFLNPVLYALPNMLHDVVNGSNYGCGGGAFPADEGWDPVTGLGTPDFEKMLQAYMSLP